MEKQRIQFKTPSFIKMLQGLWKTDTEVEDLKKLLEEVPAKDRVALLQTQEVVKKMGDALLRESTKKSATKRETAIKEETHNRIKAAKKKEQEKSEREPGE